MAFSLSPAVSVTEEDLTTSVTAAAVNTSSAVGKFAWGAVLERIFITDQDEGLNSLTHRFGFPSDDNFNDFYQCWNYLAYARSLYVVRVVAADARNAADGGASVDVVRNFDHFETIEGTLTASGKKVIAKYPGKLGDKITFHANDATTFATWGLAGEFEFAPTGTQFAVVVKNDGNIVERFLVDREPGQKDYTGITTYYYDRLNRFSNYIWIIGGHATSIVAKSGSDWVAINNLSLTLSGGLDGAEPAIGDYQKGADLFKSEKIDIKTVIQTGGLTLQEAFGKYVMESIAGTRRDCHAIVGPAITSVLGQLDPATREVSARATFGSSSYGMWASNYKYQYDRYNDKYRWVSFAGDVAGLISRAAEDEPWQSPAGYQYGKIKNVEKTAYEQSKPQRDILYPSQCNPIFVDGSDGCVLLGDKTMQAQASAFQFYNVRAVFIVMEKAIATAAKYQLFKYNDDFTRLTFKNMVVPFLRNVQSRRGIIGSSVICDERNNTPYVIDQGQFLATILAKPNRTIQGVGLRFVATSTGVDFEEIANALFQ